MHPNRCKIPLRMIAVFLRLDCPRGCTIVLRYIYLLSYHVNTWAISCGSTVQSIV